MRDDDAPLTVGAMRRLLHEQASEILKVKGNPYNKTRRGRPRRYDRKPRVEAFGPSPAPRPELLGVQRVYVIGAEGLPVKIGIASDVEGRRRELQTGSPHRLRIFAIVDVPPGAAPRVEREAHRQLAAHRLSGEWFDVPPSTAIETVQAVATKLGVP